MALDINKTYRAIIDAARAQRFISYGEIAEASNEPWNKAYRVVPQQLGKLMDIAHERGWPYLSSIVVTKENVQTGTLDGGALDGFLGAARNLGVKIDDPESFVADQQAKVFAWAKNAPDTLEAAAPTPAGGPRFVQYFGPVLDALRAMGGEARPEDVYEWIKTHLDIPQAEIAEVTKGGQSKFENKVGWARFYLAKAGLIDGARRGVWLLTPEGRETVLAYATALAIFRDVQSRFRPGDDDEVAPPTNVTGSHELFDDPQRQFWFVGAVWGADDQSDRFLSEGIWQNGYDEKFSDHVRRMRIGDRIAIKAAFVQKYNLPFDNRGKSVSCMRIKAVGVITENMDDGRTVKVDWEKLDPPRDWLFYTYRVTVVEADPQDDLARRLILFAFGGAKQDYSFWLQRPYFARKYGDSAPPLESDDILEVEEIETEEEAAAPTYTVANITAEGCFLTEQELNLALARVRAKKNLILQGPPGTGKTWLAKKLAYALIGSKDRKVTRDRLRSVQFHPSLSYEDFVRGWRPSGEGQLKLMDGVFLEIAQAAATEPDRPFVLIIEEINRGNPAQIFGEMLTLLEDSKRTAEEAVELAYRQREGERIFIPKNLHVIGTMNIADRSLALVDLALRRRFAFVNLEPQFNDLWRQWCIEKGGLAAADVDLIAARMTALNAQIGEDRSLGTQYRIGHSYVTPAEGARITDTRQWFRDVVDTELVPLLEEYWFDAPDRVKSAASVLREGL